MKSNVVSILCLLGLTTAASLPFVAQGQAAAPLQLRKTFALKSVVGRFDHFAFDESGSRLFIAATGNHSVEVLNINTGVVTQSLTGLGKPHGLAWIADQGKLFVADGTLAALKVYSGSPLKLTATLPLSDDADDMVYDSATKLLYVGHGGGSPTIPGRIAVVNTADNTLVVSLPASAHPEALDIDPVGKRVFANIADSSEIVVIDSATHTIINTWKIARAKDNVPVVYDAEDQALLLGCRTPAKAVSVDTVTGKEVSDLPSAAGADDIFYEASTHRAYLVSGSGNVDVYQVAADKSLKSLGTVKTSLGAKTGLLVPSLHVLFVGVPAAGSEPAQIRQFATGQ
jgi:hypothetical protein